MIKRRIFFIVIFACYVKVSWSQVLGCTDNQANNFNPSATANDGSCTYNSTSHSPFRLIDSFQVGVEEASGLIDYENGFWVITDSGNENAFWKLDKITGAILKKVVVKNAINNDWEEISQDNNFIYIGDFGNNSGNRTNLRILKISKASLTATKVQDTVTAQFINFAYPDQVDFTPTSNATDFDCESMLVLNDSIHLFSKNWTSKNTRHYVMKAQAGTQIPVLLDSLDVNGLITGAAIEPVSKRIVLLGYSKTGNCFIWMLWDYRPGKVFSGNKRRIELGFFLNTGQTEGICFKDSSNVYIDNEKNFGVNNHVYVVQTGLWMNKVYSGFYKDKEDIQQVKIFPNPSGDVLNLDYYLFKNSEVRYCIYDSKGALVKCLKRRYAEGICSEKFDLTDMAAGNYFLRIKTKHSEFTEKFVINR